MRRTVKPKDPNGRRLLLATAVGAVAIAGAGTAMLGMPGTAASEYVIRVRLPETPVGMPAAPPPGLNAGAPIDVADPMPAIGEIAAASDAELPSMGPAETTAVSDPIRYAEPVQYDVPGHDRQTRHLGSPISIMKRVRLNGSDIGIAMLHVAEDSTLSVRRQVLGSLLTNSGRRDLARLATGAGTGEHASFEEIRQLGIEIRYDPSSDRILLSY